MLVGYVSNERYVALAGMLFEFRRADQVATARSTISGAVYADIEPGEYEVVLGGPGHGSKIVHMEVRQDQPYQFRLLSDGLLGYMWPKCVRGGERAGYTEYTPLSLERPDPYNHIDEDEGLTDPIAGRQGCHMAAAEWRLFGWMERQGIDYDLYGETQFHFDQVPLDQYKVLVISTHPEYWSKEMYFRLKHWAFERGGRLLYLGGNGLNCEVEFLDNHRIVYHNTNWSHSEPQFAADGREYESRFDRRVESEANLLGVVFSYSGIMTAAPYRVLDDTHWCFAGTGLKNGDVFGEKSLHQRIPGGASGHETDKISPQSPTHTRLLAKGLNPDEGGAEIVEHTTASGGAVFSVGSICWPASILVDEAVSKITENAIRRYLAD
ncbi:MAG: hypothetical protein F4184_07070 [Gemmatimonadetes bacterium]|nr:hypothetical protein [Gemmatimonadota bacterium]